MLDEKLAAIKEIEDIDGVDIYGGEVGLLEPSYFYEMLNTIGKYYNGKVNVITNFIKVPDFFKDDRVNIGVSYDFSVRQQHETVLQNIMEFPKPIDILILATPQLVKHHTKTVEEDISMFSTIGNVRSVDIKPYSTNQVNQFTNDFTVFEEYVKRWVYSSSNMDFDLVNKYNIEQALSWSRNAFSDDHVYITPTGKFAILDFDEDDNEYFNEFDDISFIFVWGEMEKDNIQNNDICSSCPFLGACLSEHLRNVTSIEKSCNGFRSLLEYAKIYGTGAKRVR
jgi:hypothetical protein